MFFRKKKLPITNNDRDWVDSEIDWLIKSFGEEHFNSVKTVTPTTKFYPKKFDNKYEYAAYALKTTLDLMAIRMDTKVNLEFFNEYTTDENNAIQFDKSDNIDGSWIDTSGTYQQLNDEILIRLNENLLDNKISLIATISHELAHEILLGENRIKKNDEYLTDLVAVFYGFGIFLGNSKFSFKVTDHGLKTSWQMSSKGYLPEQIIAYATAKFSLLRNEKIEYQKFMTGQFAKTFDKTLQYLEEEKKTKHNRL